MIEEKLIEILKKRKIDEFEILKKKIKKTSVEVKNGKIEDFKNSEDIQISIRILKNKKLGFGYFAGSNFNDNEIEKIVDKTISSTEKLPYDEFLCFNEENVNENYNWENKEIHSLDFNRLTEFSKVIEQSAYNFDNRIKNVKNSGCAKGEIEVIYINSYDCQKTFKGNYISSQVVAISEMNSESYMGYENVISRKLDIDFEQIGKNAGKKAVRMFGAKKGKSFTGVVIFENEVVAELLSIISPSFYLENIEKSKSLFFKNKKGDKIANPIITIIDDGYKKDLNGSIPFDDEGVKTKEKFLIENGVLGSFLNNLHYAKKFNVEPTGNGFKPSFKTIPSISVTNLILKKGEKTLNDGIKSIKNGIFITNLMGLHMANTISGDFSLGAEGIMIENGELTNPVREIVVTGNIKEILTKTCEIFNDVKAVGSIYAPSIMVDGVKISG